MQVQLLERHVLEGRDVTWWDERGALREDREEGSAVDQIQVLPWSNTLLIRPTRTAGLPVRFRQLYKNSFSSGMFWSDAMSPGGAGR